MKVLNFLGSRSLTGPAQCQQDGSSRDIRSYKHRTKHHNLTHKSYSLFRRNSPLRNRYIFNISNLDWTTQWSTWIHFSHQVLPPAALANFLPQALLPCRPSGVDPCCSVAQEPWTPYWLLQATLPAGKSAPADPQLIPNKPCHPTPSIFTTGSW